MLILNVLIKLCINIFIKIKNQLIIIIIYNTLGQPRQLYKLHNITNDVAVTYKKRLWYGYITVTSNNIT
jgi:hypothetical protein